MDLKEYQSVVRDFIVILVLYKCKLEESISFVSLSKILKYYELKLDLVIYDNSPNTIPTKNEKNIQKYWNIYYVHDETNPGVSKAYNSGFKTAEKLGKKWIFLLDQDTTFQLDSLLKYCEAITLHKDIGLFAPVLLTKKQSIWSPCFYYLKKGHNFHKIDKYGLQSIKNKSLLNSGLIISTSVYKRVGGYQETIPLDFSDHKFIDNYRKYYDNFVLVNTKCIHGISSEIKENSENALSRFTYYCQGARNSIETTTDAILFLVNTFLRMVKLTIKFRNYQFFIIFYQKFLIG